MANKLWTDKETELARWLLAQNAPPTKFIQLINRTKAAARSRVKWLDNPSERDRANYRARKSRGKIPGAATKRFIARPTHAPEHVIADAAKRADAPRTLTAWFCGDPAPGQSALDRREQRA